MNRLTLALAAALVVATAGCDDGARTEDQIADAVADVEYENEQLRARAAELESALEEANSNIEDAKSYEGGTHEELSDGLATLEPVDEP